MPLYRFGSGTLEKYTLSMELICCNHTLPGSLRAGDICRHGQLARPGHLYQHRGSRSHAAAPPE